MTKIECLYYALSIGKITQDGYDKAMAKESAKEETKLKSDSDLDKMSKAELIAIIRSLSQ